MRGNKVHSVREMQFGSRHVFPYLECAECGCLQIIDIPQDMRQYYPAEYYSFKEPEVFAKLEKDNPAVRFLRHQRTAYMLGGSNLIGMICLAVNPSPLKLSGYIQFLKKCNCRLDTKILDVGSGTGVMLSELAWYGFSNLTGMDPFIEADFHSRNVHIYKCNIFSLKGSFDLIMFNHSFEHMDRPFDVLARARELLSDNGRVLIRIPTVSSHAWQQYGVDWISLDAPRHLFLYSLKAFGILADRAGFRIRETLYDASAFSLWGSEQYRADIPLTDERSYSVNNAKSIFSEEQMKKFDVLAGKLNAEKMGDAICLCLEIQPTERK
jgi:SAM-dependent methyltransferase